jgi:hypothetical protein
MATVTGTDKPLNACARSPLLAGYTSVTPPQARESIPGLTTDSHRPVEEVAAGELERLGAHHVRLEADGAAVVITPHVRVRHLTIATTCER